MGCFPKCRRSQSRIVLGGRRAGAWGLGSKGLDTGERDDLKMQIKGKLSIGVITSLYKCPMARGGLKSLGCL